MKGEAGCCLAWDVTIPNFGDGVPGENCTSLFKMPVARMLPQIANDDLGADSGLERTGG
jgi:hypothetical protein